MKTIPSANTPSTTKHQISSANGPLSNIIAARYPDSALSAPPGLGPVTCTLHALAPLVSQWLDPLPDVVLQQFTQLPATGPLAASGTKPARGSITDYPLWAALWQQPVSKHEQEGRVAQFIVLLATQMLERGAVSTRNDYPSAVSRACLAVRRVCMGESLLPELAVALRSSRSVADVLAACIRLREKIAAQEKPERNTEADLRVVDGLRVLLTYAVDPEKMPPLRIHGTRNANMQVEVQQVYDRDDSDEQAPCIVYSECSSRSQKDRAEASAPVSEDPGRQLVVAQLPSVPGGGRLCLRAEMWRARGRTTGIRAANQSLVHDGAQLQLVDLEALEREAHTLSQERKTDRPEHRGAVICGLILVTGRPLAELQLLRVAAKMSEVPECPDAVWLLPRQRWLVLPIRPLPSAFVPAAKDVNHYRQVEERLVLPLPVGLGLVELLLRYLERNTDALPFRGDQWADDAKAFVTWVNDQESVSTTVPRIHGFLRHQVAAQRGDDADADLLCGTGTSHARLYYYSPSVRHIRGCYQHVWTGLAMGLRDAKSPQILCAAGADQKYVGGRGCPTSESVAKMVGALIEATRRPMNGRRSNNSQRAVRIHNAVAAYTCMLLCWATGVRAVSDPIDLSMYDPFSGSLAICDKDGDAHHAARFVDLPDLARKQLDAYLRHLNVITRLYPDLMLSAPGQKIFVFDGSQPRLITPTLLRQHLPPTISLRLSSQRHYLRTRLREMNVPGEDVDALLGHGAIGQEPYARHSFFAPQRLRRVVTPAVASLMEAAGWQVIEGLRE